MQRTLPKKGEGDSDWAVIDKRYEIPVSLVLASLEAWLRVDRVL